MLCVQVRIPYEWALRRGGKYVADRVFAPPNAGPPAVRTDADRMRPSSPPALDRPISRRRTLRGRVAVITAVAAVGTLVAAPARAESGALVTWSSVSAHHCTSKSNVKESGGYLHLITQANGCGVRLESTRSYHYGDITARIKFDLARGF